MGKKKVAIVANYFVPGVLGGGPIVSLDNLVRRLAGRFDFTVYTRCHDLGRGEPYAGVDVNAAVVRDGVCKIRYLRNRDFGSYSMWSELMEQGPDLVYLNSLFSIKGSASPLAIRRLRGSGCSWLVAPRGELSPGALRTRAYRKRLFLWLCRSLRLHGDCFWHATCNDESRHIQDVIGVDCSRVFVASNLTESVGVGSEVLCAARNEFRVLFFSRIVPKKNLLYLVRVMSRVSVPVTFVVAGPVEDMGCWRDCKAEIDKLGAHISIEFVGSVTRERVPELFRKADLFAFPTLGENFGHVVMESVANGCPVLVSDRTPWKQDPGGAITVLPLDQPEDWVDLIEQRSRMSPRMHYRCVWPLSLVLS